MQRNIPLGGVLAALVALTGLAAIPPAHGAPSGNCSLANVDWSLPVEAIANTVDHNELTCSADQWRDAAIAFAYNHLTIPGASADADLMGEVHVAADAQLTVRRVSATQQGKSIEGGQAQVLAEDAERTKQSLIVIAGLEGQGFLIASVADDRDADGVLDGVGYYTHRDGAQGFSGASAQAAPMRFTAEGAKPGLNSPGSLAMSCLCGLTMASFGYQYYANLVAFSWANPIRFSYSPGSHWIALVGTPGVGLNSYPVTVSVKRFNLSTLVLPCATVTGYLYVNGCPLGSSSTFFSVTGYVYTPYLTPPTTLLWLCTGGHVTFTVFGYGIVNQPLPPVPCF